MREENLEGSFGVAIGGEAALFAAILHLDRHGGLVDGERKTDRIHTVYT
jgi:hypothetical protein